MSYIYLTWYQSHFLVAFNKRYWRFQASFIVLRLSHIAPCIHTLPRAISFSNRVQPVVHPDLQGNRPEFVKLAQIRQPGPAIRPDSASKFVKLAQIRQPGPAIRPDSASKFVKPAQRLDPVSWPSCPSRPNFPFFFPNSILHIEFEEGY